MGVVVLNGGRVAVVLSGGCCPEWRLLSCVGAVVLSGDCCPEWGLLS